MTRRVPKAFREALVSCTCVLGLRTTSPVARSYRTWMPGRVDPRLMIGEDPHTVSVSVSGEIPRIELRGSAPRKGDGSAAYREENHR